MSARVAKSRDRAIAQPTTRASTRAAEGWTLTNEQLAGMALWDRDVMLDERHRAVGAMLVSAAVREIRRSRAMEQRLLAWAEQLEGASPVEANIAAELRNHLRVGCSAHSGTACGWIDGECSTQEAPASIFDAAGRVNPEVFADPAEAAELQAELDAEAGHGKGGYSASAPPPSSPAAPSAPAAQAVGAAVRFHLDRAAHHEEVAKRIRGEDGDPNWDIDQADSNRRQAYVLRQEAVSGMRCCSRCLRLGHTRLGERECNAPWTPVPLDQIEDGGPSPLRRAPTE